MGARRNSQGVHSKADLLGQRDSGARRAGGSASVSAHGQRVRPGRLQPHGAQEPHQSHSHTDVYVEEGRPCLEAAPNLCCLHSELLLLPPAPFAPFCSNSCSDPILWYSTRSQEATYSWPTQLSYL